MIIFNLGANNMKNKSIPLPTVINLPYKKYTPNDFNTYLIEKNFNESDHSLLLEYPTVYVVHDRKGEQYDIYIGETSNILNRTNQHIDTDSQGREDWKKFAKSSSSELFVIGHEYFNKSLTLDIENRLMQYMLSVDKVRHLNNRRTNPQNKYYTSEHLDTIFTYVWDNLRELDQNLFPSESEIFNSALFKASPFHKLTYEQLEAKEKIKERVIELIVNPQEDPQLVLVTGEAGSGKTVLMSSLFYELHKMHDEYPDINELEDLSIYLLVNHDQQKLVYEQISKRLNLYDKEVKNVAKPSTFIKTHEPNHSVDVVVIDEAHLLATRGNQGYSGNNHLKDILKRAKIVVAVFDKNQIINNDHFWEQDDLEFIHSMAENNNNLIHLNNQMRINAEPRTVKWIRDITDHKKITNIPSDSKGYEIKVFDSAKELHQAVKLADKKQDNGISRVVATYDWDYNNAKRPDDKEFWLVEDDGYQIPWNYEYEKTKKVKVDKKLAWAEQPHTINESGSTFSIQGFDLNVAGVIIGPSVTFKDGKVQFIGDHTKNRKVKTKRTLKDGSKQNFDKFLLKNELNVLLTRGVKGLYLYAVDDALQEELLKAQEGVLLDE